MQNVHNDFQAAPCPGYAINNYHLFPLFLVQIFIRFIRQQSVRKSLERRQTFFTKIEHPLRLGGLSVLVTPPTLWRPSPEAYEKYFSSRNVHPIRDGTRNSSILEVPDLFSLLDSPRNRFYHSSSPRGPRQNSSRTSKKRAKL